MAYTHQDLKKNIVFELRKNRIFLDMLTRSSSSMVFGIPLANGEVSLLRAFSKAGVTSLWSKTYFLIKEPNARYLSTSTLEPSSKACLEKKNYKLNRCLSLKKLRIV